MCFFFNESSAYGGASSLASRSDKRKAEGFESFDEALIRTKLDKEKIELGQKRPRNHTGSLNRFDWDSKDCLNHVNEVYF